MGNMHNIPLLFLSLGIPERYMSTSSSLVDGNMIFKKKEDPAERMMCFNLYSSHSNLLSSIVLCVTLTEVSRYLSYQLVIVRNRREATVCTRTVATKWSSEQKTLSPAKMVYSKEPVWVNIFESRKKSKLSMYKYVHNYIVFSKR